MNDKLNDLIIKRLLIKRAYSNGNLDEHVYQETLSKIENEIRQLEEIRSIHHKQATDANKRMLEALNN